MFILSNGDIYDDEEIYGEQIHEYPEDISNDENTYTGNNDECIEEMINEWEHRLLI